MMHGKNPRACYSACPILTDQEIAPYLAKGQIPANPEYLEVPPGKVIRKRGFWLRPSVRMHHAAVLFLVSTDVYAMNEDDHAELREQIYCYRSPQANTAYLGRAEEVNCCHRTLFPLLEGLHDPLDIQAYRLVYVGRVIAAK